MTKNYPDYIFFDSTNQLGKDRQLSGEGRIKKKQNPNSHLIKEKDI